MNILIVLSVVVIITTLIELYNNDLSFGTIYAAGIAAACSLFSFAGKEYLLGVLLALPTVCIILREFWGLFDGRMQS